MAVADGLSVHLHRRSALAVLEATGADARDYLHRMLTQDLRGFEVGAVRYACLLTVKGRILGDLLVWNLGPRLLLDVPAAAAPTVQAALERTVIADDVTLRDVSAAEARFVLFGPAAAEALAAAGVAVPAQGHMLEVEIGGRPARLARFDRRGLVAFEIGVPADVAGALEARLDLSEDGTAYAAACVAHAIPRYGHDFGEDVLLNEAGLEEAVSWNKGCYPGQEPVVMARHRGRPPRLLVQLRLAEAGALAAGAAVLLDGEPVGHVTSVSPDGRCALALVKHALAEEGRAFELAGGLRATVRLPAVEVC